MNLPPSNTGPLRMYSNDMLALERHILEAVARQNDDARVTGPAKEVISAIHAQLREHVSVMETHVAALGDTAGGKVKEAVTSIAGAVAGLYDKVRNDPVARMLRDDYTALNLAAIGYSMLHTSALALHDAAVANVALRHLRNLTPLVLQLNQVIPGACVAELAEDGYDTDASVVPTAVEHINEAWQVHSR